MELGMPMPARRELSVSATSWLQGGCSCTDNTGYHTLTTESSSRYETPVRPLGPFTLACMWRRGTRAVCLGCTAKRPLLVRERHRRHLEAL